MGNDNRRGWTSEATVCIETEVQISSWQFKCQMWNVCLQNLKSGEVWKVAKIGNSQVGTTVESFTKWAGKQANPICKTEEVFSGVSVAISNGILYNKQSLP